MTCCHFKEETYSVDALKDAGQVTKGSVDLVVSLCKGSSVPQWPSGATPRWYSSGLLNTHSSYLATSSSGVLRFYFISNLSIPLLIFLRVDLLAHMTFTYLFTD